jgi:hypothetical protein
MTRLELPGSQSIRSQMGIVQEDPEVFRPYTLTEAKRAAEVLAGDRDIPAPVRRLLTVGLALDLRPGHLTPSKSHLALFLRHDRKTIASRELRWESVESSLRADLVGRAVSMILLWRATSRR